MTWGTIVRLKFGLLSAVCGLFPSYDYTQSCTNDSMWYWDYFVYL